MAAVLGIGRETRVFSPGKSVTMGVRLGVQVLSVAPRSSSSQSTRSYRYTVSGTSTTVRSRKWGGWRRPGDGVSVLAAAPAVREPERATLPHHPAMHGAALGKNLMTAHSAHGFATQNPPLHTSIHVHGYAIRLHSDTIIAYVRWCQRALLARRHLAPARLIASTGMSISAGWA